MEKLFHKYCICFKWFRLQTVRLHTERDLIFYGKPIYNGCKIIIYVVHTSHLMIPW